MQKSPSHAGCLIALLLVVGCSKQPSTFTPTLQAPGGSNTAALVDAAFWTQASPDRYFATVADTRSMEPVINKNSILLCVRNTGQPIKPGLIAVFNRGDAPRVVHTIAAVSGTSAYFSGLNNSRSDGWYPSSAIEGFVVGHLFTP